MNEAPAKLLKNLLSEIGYKQLVTDPTQIAGHVIDLFLTNDVNLVESIFLNAFVQSDHKAIVSDINVVRRVPEYLSRPGKTIKNWNQVNSIIFFNSINEKFFRNNFLNIYDSDSLISLFNETFSQTTNEAVPVKYIGSAPSAG